MSKKCNKCGFDNDPNALYCQKCGSLLKNKGFKNYIKSLKLGSVAGAGAKGISIAPLAGIQLDKNTDANKNFKRVTKQYTLEDGSWYCPYCGTRNFLK